LKDEDLKTMDDKLRRAKIDKESKIIIQEKIVNMDGTINKTIEEKFKQLEEKVQAGVVGGNTTNRKK